MGSRPLYWALGTVRVGRGEQVRDTGSEFEGWETAKSVGARRAVDASGTAETTSDVGGNLRDNFKRVNCIYSRSFFLLLQGVVVTTPSPLFLFLPLTSR